DAYASWGGYRAPRDMKCIILDREDGEVMRLTANVGMVERQLRAANDNKPAGAAANG
ncbi:oxidoreductase, partial [Acinetobacter baumannii]|nr:oxidoreductase [Acinetobacter baumannii]